MRRSLLTGVHFDVIVIPTLKINQKYMNTIGDGDDEGKREELTGAAKIVADMNEVLDERLAPDCGIYLENESNPEDRLHVIQYIFYNVRWADPEMGVSIIEKLFDFLAKWEDSVYFKDEFQYRLYGYLDQLSRRGLKDGPLVERLNKLLDVSYFHARVREINKDYVFGYFGYSYKRKRR